MDSEDRYRRLFEAAQEGIMILDAQAGVILDANPFLEKMLEYSHAELLGKTLWELGHPKDVDASIHAFQELISKGHMHYEHLPLTTKGGLCISVEVTGYVYRVNEEKVVQCNIRRIGRRKDDDRPEQRKRQTLNMEAIGQLAGGMAHDLNNLLGVIAGYCEILEDQAALPEPTRKMIQEIHNAEESAGKLTQRMLAFSRGQVLQLVALDLNETVSRMEKMLSPVIGKDIELISLLGSGLGSINADSSQLEQVLMNLAINARDAMPKGGKLVTETANVEIDETNAQQYPSMRPGRYVMLTASDTGTGMNPETQSRIFEPFFTTKPPGRGSGLGLSIVFGIVEQSGGTIAVHSVPGAGTTFNIYFPRSDKATEAMRQGKAEPARGGTETILLVDDAASLRGLIRRLLEEGGYTVLDSGDPVEALRMATEHPGPMPLMITDVVLPGFSGSVLAERVAEVRPETKVLYVSGYNDDSIVPLRVLGQDYAFLEKPFTRDDLLRKVRQLLDSSMKFPLWSAL
jgi:PAS domain S-box-containing protein